MQPTSTTIGAGALLIALSVTACAADSSAVDPTSPSATPEGEETLTPPPAADGTAPEYRDGEYSATGWYGSAPSHHDVTLTIDDDIITAVEITTPAEDETSLGYQQRFAAALPDAVIGRNIDELEVDRLAGSSGCSEGFMDALAKIKDEAAA